MYDQNPSCIGYFIDFLLNSSTDLDDLESENPSVCTIKVVPDRAEEDKALGILRLQELNIILY